MHAPQVVSATEWTEAIEELRAEEKRATREPYQWCDATTAEVTAR